MPPDDGDEYQPRFETVYLAILTRGPNWTAERTEEVTALGQAHLANIRRLADAGHLLLAGPAEDPDGVYAGFFVLDAGSLDEAEALVATDPAADAGRFAIEVIPWKLGRGTLDPLTGD
ncbi:MAG: YciI family protein [Halobacteriota archaeon]